MLGSNGKPFSVYNEETPIKVTIKPKVPYRSPVNADGHYDSHFCDSCAGEFEEGETAVQVVAKIQDWESDMCFHELYLCLNCWKGGLGNADTETKE